MNWSKTAKVYAEALYDFASEQNRIDAITSDVATVAEIINGSRELSQVVANPIVKPSDKHAILLQVLKDGVSAEFLQFLALLQKKNRIDVLPEMLDAFKAIRDDRQSILRVQVKSATALTDEQLESLRNSLQKQYSRNIIFSQEISPDVLGGFVLKVGDTIIDASMANKLIELKKKFINTSLSA
ncbi:MAG: ATP synthase F1 subunit delta [Ignavibacteria bacterium]|nr:ATP synthase F1 subunit delta [Ignavibacteria bacterium]